MGTANRHGNSPSCRKEEDVLCAEARPGGVGSADCKFAPERKECGGRDNKLHNNQESWFSLG